MEKALYETSLKVWREEKDGKHYIEVLKDKKAIKVCIEDLSDDELIGFFPEHIIKLWLALESKGRGGH